MKRYGKTTNQQNKYYEVPNIYEYMIETYINGNFTQFGIIHKELCQDAKRNFIVYCFSEVNPQLLQEIILRTI